jgi:hypothetical protein
MQQISTPVQQTGFHAAQGAPHQARVNQDLVPYQTTVSGSYEASMSEYCIQATIRSGYKYKNEVRTRDCDGHLACDPVTAAPCKVGKSSTRLANLDKIHHVMSSTGFISHSSLMISEDVALREYPIYPARR